MNAIQLEIIRNAAGLLRGTCDTIIEATQSDPPKKMLLSMVANELQPLAALVHDSIKGTRS